MGLRSRLNQINITYCYAILLCNIIYSASCQTETEKISFDVNYLVNRMSNETYQILEKFKDKSLLHYYSSGWQSNPDGLTVDEARMLILKYMDSVNIKGNSIILTERLEKFQPRRLSYIINIDGKSCFFLELDEEKKSFFVLDPPNGFDCGNKNYQEIPIMNFNENNEAPIVELHIVTHFTKNNSNEIVYNSCSIIGIPGYR